MSFSFKKNAQLSSRKMLRFGVYLTLFCLAGCNACPRIEDIEQELNNGNDDPAVLILETWGTEVKNALEDPFFGWSNNCLGTPNFTGRLEIVVRTGSIDDQGTIIFDPAAYFDRTFTGVTFANNTGFNDGTQTTIEVPETGAYLLQYSLEVDLCSLCCHGESDDQCGTDENGGKCQGGMPRVMYERPFTSANRPPHDLNHKITSGDFRIRSCVCPSTPCFTDC